MYRNQYGSDRAAVSGLNYQLCYTPEDMGRKKIMVWSTELF